jgi:hypothetical protein
MKVSPWITDQWSAYRHIAGASPLDVTQRVALIEKTPRVRIRPDHFGLERSHYDDGTPFEKRIWPPFLDWCERNYKGSGPGDPESRQWCDDMLELQGYILT